MSRASFERALGADSARSGQARALDSRSYGTPGLARGVLYVRSHHV